MWIYDTETGEIRDDDNRIVAKSPEPPYSTDELTSAIRARAAAAIKSGDYEKAMNAILALAANDYEMR